MASKDLKIEKDDPSSKLATEIAEVLNKLVGAHEWSGDSPFEIKMLDQQTGLVCSYKIRRGKDWITIREIVGDTSVRTFNLEKREDKWTYVDVYLAKYKTSSLDKLKAAYEKLKIAIEAAAPR